MFSNDEIIYAAFSMDPRDAEPEPVETITEDQLTKVLQCPVLHEAFKTYHGRRPRFHREGRELLSKTPDEVDAWVSDLFSKASAYSAGLFYRPMLPHMLFFYTGEQPA